MQQYTIGQLAKAAGCGVETIRFYERKGLIKQPPKPYSGWRDYGENHLAIIRFIKRSKKLGFTLAETGSLLNLQFSSSAITCDRSLKSVEKKLSEIEEKIEGLKAIKEHLSELHRSCRERSPSDRCPILKEMHYGKHKD